VIGDLNSPHGNNSNRLAPPTGFPAMTMPMGFVHGRLPAGLQILGRPWSEATLIKIGYAYEQATLHRRPPANSADRQAWGRNYWLSAAVDARLRESRVIGMARTGNRVPQSDGLRPFKPPIHRQNELRVFASLADAKARLD
jgi:hypothetical protein